MAGVKRSLLGEPSHLAIGRGMWGRDAPAGAGKILAERKRMAVTYTWGHLKVGTVEEAMQTRIESPFSSTPPFSEFPQ